MDTLVFLLTALAIILASEIISMKVLSAVESTEQRKSLRLINYYPSDDPEDFLTAAAICKRRGMKLAELITLEDQIEFMGYFKEKGDIFRKFWISGNRFGGKWKWGTKGPEFNFTFWGPGQPNNLYADQECVATLTRSMKWDDKTCDNKYHYVCQQ